MAGWLANHWQQQTDPIDIYNTLWQAGWLGFSYIPARSPDSLSVESGNWMVVDIDNDGNEEWVVNLVVCDQSGGKWEGSPDCDYYGESTQLGDLWIVNKSGIAYRAYTEPGRLESVPIVIAQADFTGDKIPDLVIATESCGAHTCSNSYRIISGHTGKIKDAIRSYSTTRTAIRTTNSVAYIVDRGDGINDFVISGGRIGSVGAGPQRTSTDTWSWNGHDISLYKREYSSIGHVVHALYEANNAYDDFDLQLADSWYTRVLFDETLHVWESGEREMSQQFASFRLILLHLPRAGEDEANIWKEWLELHFPESPLVQAASILIKEWQRHDDLSIACETVTVYLQEEDSKIRQEENSGRYYGTGEDGGLLYPIEIVGNYSVNPELSVADVCILTGYEP